jgi:hypothetical protein
MIERILFSKPSGSEAKVMRAWSEGSREMKSDAFETPAIAKHARKGRNEGKPEDRGGSERMTVRMCSNNTNHGPLNHETITAPDRPCDFLWFVESDTTSY